MVVSLNNHGNTNENVIEPRPRMGFKIENEFIHYHPKQYGKHIEFRVMIQRSKMKDNGSVRYVIHGCAHGN